MLVLNCNSDFNPDINIDDCLALAMTLILIFLCGRNGKHDHDPSRAGCPFMVVLPSTLGSWSFVRHRGIEWVDEYTER